MDGTPNGNRAVVLGRFRIAVKLGCTLSPVPGSKPHTRVVRGQSTGAVEGGKPVRERLGRSDVNVAPIGVVCVLGDAE